MTSSAFLVLILVIIQFSMTPFYLHCLPWSPHTAFHKYLTLQLLESIIPLRKLEREMISSTTWKKMNRTRSYKYRDPQWRLKPGSPLDLTQLKVVWHLLGWKGPIRPSLVRATGSRSRARSSFCLPLGPAGQEAAGQEAIPSTPLHQVARIRVNTLEG